MVPYAVEIVKPLEAICAVFPSVSPETGSNKGEENEYNSVGRISISIYPADSPTTGNTKKSINQICFEQDCCLKNAISVKEIYNQ